jgi:predicted lysophospholipase L1 biosynthesis ABC-type transport system permease subunit
MRIQGVHVGSLLKLAWRDLVAAPRSSLPIFAIIALSVWAQTAVRSMAGTLQRALNDQIRVGHGADLAIETSENPNPAQLEVLETLRARGMEWTMATYTLFTAKSDQAPNPIPAVIKAVDPKSYPLFGALRLDPSQPLVQALAGSSALVSTELLREMGVQVGDEFRLNGLRYRVSGRIEYEPDRFVRNFGSPLRIIVSGETLERSRVLRRDVPILYRIMLRLPSNADTDSIQAEMEKIFPEAGVLGIRQVNRQGADAVDVASQGMAISVWFAFLVGAIGLTMGSRFHVLSRMGTLATLKSLGARPSHACVWLVFQFLMLGGGGGLLGTGGGIASRATLLWIAHVRPGQDDARTAVLTLEGVAGGVILSCFGLFGAVSAGRLRPALLWRGSLGRSSSGTRLRFHFRRPLVRYAMGNVFRRGRDVPNMLSVIALVAVLVTSVAASQDLIVREILHNLPVPDANLVLMGFPDGQLSGIRSILDRHAGIKRPYNFLNFAWAHVSAGGRTPTLWLTGCFDEVPAKSGAVVDSSAARSLGLKAGAPVEFDAGGKTIRTTVLEIRDVPPAERTWHSVTVPCSMLRANVILHAAMLRVNPDELNELGRDLRFHYPALGIAAPSDFLEGVVKMVRMSAAFVSFLAAFTALAGVTIAAALFAAASRQRAREIAILQALGATPRRIAGILTMEFALLGSLAGLTGGVVSITGINVILSVAFERLVFDLPLSAIGAAIVSGAVLASAAGWLGCGHVLRQRPLITLRRE